MQQELPQRLDGIVVNDMIDLTKYSDLTNFINGFRKSISVFKHIDKIFYKKFIKTLLLIDEDLTYMHGETQAYSSIFGNNMTFIRLDTEYQRLSRTIQNSINIQNEYLNLITILQNDYVLMNYNRKYRNLAKIYKRYIKLLHINVNDRNFSNLYKEYDILIRLYTKFNNIEIHKQFRKYYQRFSKNIKEIYKLSQKFFQ